MSDRPYFPIFLDLSSKDILFVGGGRIAAGRIEVLLDYTTRVTVVSPELDKQISDMISRGAPVVWKQKRYELSDVYGRDIVFAATDDKKLNEEIGAECRRRKITVNVVSDKKLCDFYFPGIVRRGNTVIGINASGTDHSGVKRARISIEEMLAREEE